MRRVPDSTSVGVHLLKLLLFLLSSLSALLSSVEPPGQVIDLAAPLLPELFKLSLKAVDVLLILVLALLEFLLCLVQLLLSPVPEVSLRDAVLQTSSVRCVFLWDWLPAWPRPRRWRPAGAHGPGGRWCWGPLAALRRQRYPRIARCCRLLLRLRIATLVRVQLLSAEARLLHTKRVEGGDGLVYAQRRGLGLDLCFAAHISRLFDLDGHTVVVLECAELDVSGSGMHDLIRSNSPAEVARLGGRHRRAR